MLFDWLPDESRDVKQQFVRGEGGTKKHTNARTQKKKTREQSRREERNRDVRVYLVRRGGRCAPRGAAALEIIALGALARRFGGVALGAGGD